MTNVSWIPSKERRRRLKRPRLLVFFGVAIILLPLINYIGLCMKYGKPFYEVHYVIASASMPEMAYLFSSLAAGTGLLLIARWGWLFFVFAGGVFVAHNIYWLVQYPAANSRGPLLQTALVMAALFYFLQRDIFMPYLRVHSGGFRIFKRYPLALKVQVNGIQLLTSNASAGGLYTPWSSCPFAHGTQVEIKLELGGKEYQFSGGIASTHFKDGVGIAFRNVSTKDRIAFEKALRAEAARQGI